MRTTVVHLFGLDHGIWDIKLAREVNIGKAYQNYFRWRLCWDPRHALLNPDPCGPCRLHSDVVHSEQLAQNQKGNRVLHEQTKVLEW